MTEGPLGRDLIFIDDNKSVLTLVGIDDTQLPRSERANMESAVERHLRTQAREGGNDFIEAVNLTVGTNPSEEQRRELGGATLITHQYEVETSFDEIPQRVVNAIHNSVLDALEDIGVNVTGAKTTVV